VAVSETTVPQSVNRPKPRGPQRRVQLPWLAAAAGLALLVALIVLWGFGRVAERREVVTVVEPVDAGQPISRGSIGFTMVAVDSSTSRLFSAGQADELVGLLAAVDLEPGDLLGPSLISARPALPAGWVEVGAVLRPGWYPRTLVTGDDVWAVSSAAGSVQVPVLVVEDSGGDDGTVTVVLAVEPFAATQVAQWAASGELVLIRRPAADLEMVEPSAALPESMVPTPVTTGG
jgi:hypothetical protein